MILVVRYLTTCFTTTTEVRNQTLQVPVYTSKKTQPVCGTVLQDVPGSEGNK